ncbi:MAG: hypothetical protein IKA31_03225 [Clostridia bacterium]|nr:hypothetical protein [Clostridia bacterium]
MFIVVCFIIALLIGVGGLWLLFSLARKQDKKKKEIDEMLEEHKKNKGE